MDQTGVMAGSLCIHDVPPAGGICPHLQADEDLAYVLRFRGIGELADLLCVDCAGCLIRNPDGSVDFRVCAPDKASFINCEILDDELDVTIRAQAMATLYRVDDRHLLDNFPSVLDLSVDAPTGCTPAPAQQHAPRP